LPATPPDADAAPAAPDHLGHRERLRQRFLTGSPDALADYELPYRAIAQHEKGLLNQQVRALQIELTAV